MQPPEAIRRGREESKSHPLEGVVLLMDGILESSELAVLCFWGLHSMFLSLMIRLMRIDLKRTVHLLEQDHPHQLVWKGHAAEAELHVCTLQHRRAEPQ